MAGVGEPAGRRSARRRVDTPENRRLELGTPVGLRTYRYMAYIICEPCVDTKDTACVDVCPVDCIHPRKDEPAFATATMLFIHPHECIDCGACVPACPVEAIFPLEETPGKWTAYIDANRTFFDT